MAFNSIPQSWIASGKFAVQSLLQYIKDNFDALNSAIFGLGYVDVPNGSFEIDSDLDGIPDNWTQNLYPGGSATLDSTTQASGTKSLKFTSPGGAGNGGGYYDSDYSPCNELRSINIGFSHKSSVADIHNQVILRWYTAAKVYVSSTTIYDEAAVNPTSWTRFVRSAVPVATARYFKVRLVGANSDDATAGSAWFDEVSAYDTGSNWQIHTTGIAENSLLNSATWTDSGSVSITLPTLGNAMSLARLSFIAQQKGNDCEQRFRVGSSFSDEFITSSSGAYVDKRYSLPCEGTGGTVTLYQQLKVTSGSGTAYGKLNATDIYAELVHK